MENYHYSPLLPGEFTRVLALQPAKSRADGLRCQLLHVPPGFPYIAISYAWGPQYGWSDLVIEDSNRHRPPSVLKITPTVKVLLRRMRGSSQVRYLWVDALCINQADDAEKMQQVSRMFDIYRMAYRVFAWLGHEDGHGSDFLKVIKSIAIEGDDVLDRHIESDGIGDLHCFFETPWFSRRWVIQEVAAARNAVLVDAHTHMDFDAFARLKITKSRTLGLIEAISRVRDPGDSSRHLSFTALFPIFHNAECSDDRDKIYSLLGLDSLTSSPRTGMIMMPDYTLSTNECYESVATKLAERSAQDLFAVMQCAGAFPQEHVDLGFKPPRYGKWERTPSWVPDWTMGRLFRPLFCSKNSLRAGHAPPAQPIRQPTISEQGVMRLDGLLLGRITHMSTNWCMEGIGDEYIIYHALKWWLVLIESGLIDEPKYSGESRSIIGDFAKTITAGQIDLQFEPVFESPSGVSGGQRHISKESSRKAFNKLLITWLRRAKLLFGQNVSLVTMATDSSLNIGRQHLLIGTTCFADENIPSDAHPEVRRVHQIMEGRNFFVTDSGHMGVCSPWAVTGDIVGIPFGATTPFVFRSRAEMDPRQVEQRVSLVGDCYVDGVMEGQACQQPGVMRCTFVVE